ncbi:putative manganese-dependent inorganic diphosphatase [uncultured Cetobacterium sp.]|uniref:putative manganese-dependent inorganic diphosphatase n=1 Tax=uncultured Cetobacterium sp. TaxID=527638 RepID=UPI002606EB8C|nr:putative manganese-dependent inorganic diphosphatase [uncultured Cetobacterium sp.]
MEPILIFGHKNPDTDSICSALSLATLKELQGEKAQACRLGNISKETEFVLNKFNIEAPMFLSTVSAQISDLTHIEKKTINHKDSLKKALEIMTKENYSSLPVVNSKNHLKGMIHISEIANAYLNIDYADLFTKYHTTYENLKHVLNGEVVSGEYPTGQIQANLKGVSEYRNISSGDIVITTTLLDSVDDLIELGVKMIILCCDKEDVILPRDSKTPILRVNGSLFRTIPLISQSISILSILGNEKFYSFSTDDHLIDIKDIMKESSQTNFPVIDNNGEVYGTIRTKNLINFNRKKVVLVDHNEATQSVDGLKDSRIIQVVDHHKFGNFETNEPVRINAETVGSTCTIVYDLYKDADIIPPKEMAGLMLSAILSDTLMFKSPTCTEKDIEVAKELAKIAEVNDFQTYGMDMLIAGTSLSDKTPEEILTMDQKEFTMNGIKLAISQVNTVDVKGLLDQKENLENVMNKTNEVKGYQLSVLVITDIVKAGSMLLVIGDSNIVEKGFHTQLENNTAWVDGVVSRKKQVVPFLMAASQGV